MRCLSGVHRYAGNFAWRQLYWPGPDGASTGLRRPARSSQRPRASTTVGEAAHAIRFLHFLAPQLTPDLAAFFMRAYFRRARSVPPTDGNLFAPPAKAGGIDGGLRSRRPSLPVVALGLVAAAGIGALLLLSGRT